MITDLAFTPDGELLLAADVDGGLRVWSPRQRHLLWTYQARGAGIYWIRLRPDGWQLATAGLEPEPRLWSLPRFSGSLAELAELVRCRVPWALDGAELVERTPDCPEPSP